jgi:mono/diheme cytochrome c family protein
VSRLPILAILGVLLLAGCKDPRKDMNLQPKHEPYGAANVFPDGASARPLVAGTVPRDPADVPSRAWAAAVYEPEVMTPVNAPAGSAIPFPVDRGVIDRGRAGFEIYCAVCHGRLGNGQGMIVQRGFPRPPSFHVDRLIGEADAHFYDVITNGFGAMYSYAQRVPPRQRWEIVAYVRALQEAGRTAPEEQRRVLIAMGDRPPPTTLPAASQTPATRPAGGTP